MKPFAMFFLILLFLSSCTTVSDGFFIQRTNNLYDLQVGINLVDPESKFYRGAYELCKSLKGTGFTIRAKNWETRARGNERIRGTVLCEGEVDPFLVAKYKSRPMKMEIENSNIGFLSGKSYRLVPVKTSSAD